MHRICSLRQWVCRWHSFTFLQSSRCWKICTQLLMDHFRRWGLEVHAGSYHPFKGSKTELLFCARPLSTYQDPSTCDNTDMTDLILPNGRFVPVVTKFKYSQVASPIFQAMDRHNRCSISDRFCSSCLWINKTSIGEPKAQSMNLWFYQSAYMGARVGALPKSCTPSFANFTLEVLELWVTSR